MRRKTRQIAFRTLRDMPKDELAMRFSGSPEEAAASIASAARFGLVEAQLLFGQVLLDGRGTPRDPAAAVLWFGAAASAGSAEAMNMLGRCHEMGWGVRSDRAVAAVWYARAADAWPRLGAVQSCQPDTARSRCSPGPAQGAVSLPRRGTLRSCQVHEHDRAVLRGGLGGRCATRGAPSNGIGAGPKGAISAHSTTLALC